jgi:hypothetical protein
LSHSKFDFVIRFERIADDFDAALRMIGIEPVRRLPQLNSTSARSRSFADYYSPQAIQRARRIMGPYMEQWGYEFPPEWNISPPSRSDRLAYQAFSQVAQQYWRHVRPRT